MINKDKQQDATENILAARKKTEAAFYYA